VGRVVARRTGLLIGGSAGGVVYEALTRVSALPPGTTMVPVDELLTKLREN
jgi:cystathionine beta-synthase